MRVCICVYMCVYVCICVYMCVYVCVIFSGGRRLNLTIDKRVIDRKLWCIYSVIYGLRSTVQ